MTKVQPNENTGTITDERRYRFFMIDNEIIDLYIAGGFIDSTDFLVYSYMVRRAGDKGHAWPSYPTIAKDIGKSRRAAMQSVKKMAGEDIDGVSMILNKEGNALPALIRITPRFRDDGSQSSNDYTIIDIKDTINEWSRFARGGAWNDTGGVSDTARGGCLILHPFKNTQLRKLNEENSLEESRASDEAPAGALAPASANAEEFSPEEDSSLTGMKNFGKGSLERRKKKEHGSAPRAQKNDMRVWGMVAAYNEARGIPHQSATESSKSAAYNIFAKLPPMYGKEEVRGCTEYLYSQTWWQEPGRLTARKVADTVIEWVNRGRPEKEAPKQGSSGTSKLVSEMEDFIKYAEEQGL